MDLASVLLITGPPGFMGLDSAPGSCLCFHQDSHSELCLYWGNALVLSLFPSFLWYPAKDVEFLCLEMLLEFLS